MESTPQSFQGSRLMLAKVSTIASIVLLLRWEEQEHGPVHTLFALTGHTSEPSYQPH